MRRLLIVLAVLAVGAPSLAQSGALPDRTNSRYSFLGRGSAGVALRIENVGRTALRIVLPPGLPLRDGGGHVVLLARSVDLRLEPGQTLEAEHPVFTLAPDQEVGSGPLDVAAEAGLSLPVRIALAAASGLGHLSEDRRRAVTQWALWSALSPALGRQARDALGADFDLVQLVIDQAQRLPTPRGF